MFAEKHESSSHSRVTLKACSGQPQKVTLASFFQVTLIVMGFRVLAAGKAVHNAIVSCTSGKEGHLSLNRIPAS